MTSLIGGDKTPSHRPFHKGLRKYVNYQHAQLARAWLARRKSSNNDHCHMQHISLTLNAGVRELPGGASQTHRSREFDLGLLPDGIVKHYLILGVSDVAAFEPKLSRDCFGDLHLPL